MLRLTPIILLALPVMSAATPRLRVESAYGHDTNVTRTEGTEREGDEVLRVLLDAQELLRLHGTRLRATYRGGAKQFTHHNGEDALFQHLDVSATFPTGPVHLTARGTIRDRATRAPEISRDHTSLTGGGGLAAALPWDLRIDLSGQVERLSYKANEDYSATARGLSLSLARRMDELTLSLRGAWSTRVFDGTPLVFGGVDPEGRSIVAQATNGQRRDTTWVGAVGAGWSGHWIGKIEYAVARNDSNSFRSGLTRHALSVTTTTDLPLGLVGALKLGVHRVSYDDPQNVYSDEISILVDENRSSATLRLEYPFTDNWSAVGHLGAWSSPFGGGPEYERYVGLLGVAFNGG